MLPCTPFVTLYFEGHKVRPTMAYLHPPLENDGIMAWRFAECEGAHRFGALIFVSKEKIVKAFVAERLKEPFTVDMTVSVPSLKSCIEASRAYI